MAYPTRLEVVQSWQWCCDDPSGRVFNDTAPANQISLAQQSLNLAYTALYKACYNYEVPRITDIIDQVMVPPGTMSLTPAQMISPAYPNGIQSFSQYEWLSERPWGSEQRFIDLTPVDRLTQRQPSDRLKEFVYRNDTFYFLGCNTLIELKMEFEFSGLAPTSNTAQVLIDECGSFLAWFMAGFALQLKGRKAQADMYMNQAVGPKYAQGEIGGELWRIIQPLVRQQQKVPISKKPYSANRRLMVRMPVPYVAAQQGTTGGGAQNVPQQFSTADGTLVGLVNGSNAVFWAPIGGVTTMLVYRNGVLQTNGLDYTALGNQITFTAANIPQGPSGGSPGDVITAEVFVTYQMPGTQFQAGYNTGGYNTGGFGGG